MNRVSFTPQIKHIIVNRTMPQSLYHRLRWSSDQLYSQQQGQEQENESYQQLLLPFQGVPTEYFFLHYPMNINNIKLCKELREKIYWSAIICYISEMKMSIKQRKSNEIKSVITSFLPKILHWVLRSYLIQWIQDRCS